MAFEPDKIRKQHILDAVTKIERQNISLEPSTRYVVIINGKPYPPKEIMRYAHELMNGERHEQAWYGGTPTNKYLTALGFEIKSKFDTNSSTVTGNLWKLGCNWGKGAPSFYELIKRENIVIGENNKKYQVGDLILICEGHTVNAIARVNETPISVIANEEYEEPFQTLKIDYEEWVNYADAEWYELNDGEELYYQLQQGIVRVNPSHEVYKKALEIWNDRNKNYWIFQGNPNAFNFEIALRNNLLEDWTASAHKDKIKVGDKVILWISGRNAGCYALAEVTSEPRINSDSKDSHLWKIEDKNPLKAGIKITQNLIDSPLLWSKIRGIKGLENLKVGNQGTNFTATKREYKIIYDLINNSTELKNKADMEAKNIILYGPPGTGKTYNSIDKAVEIASTERFNLNNHAANKNVFDELRKVGQIEFVTFHQNYSYEDFMVGLKPDVENENLRFKSHKGIFYELCKRAKENYLNYVSGKGKRKSVDEVLEELLRPLEIGNEVEIKMISGISFWITEVSDKTIYFRKQSGGTAHTLSIGSLNELVEGVREIPSGLSPYYTPLINLIKENRETKEKAEPLLSYVLIIDEINRANISKVFGELITLLEDDKRLGGENELKITLPNGEKEFGVPPNLYIIGTMNTADKSIALIDIALRRRFEFIGYYPEYEELNDEASILLKIINEAVFKEKKSADYLIGHAYFMKGQTIQTVLQNKVVPLLMEYFSGKTDIVAKIFADTNWNVTYNTTNFVWDISLR